MTKRDTSRSRTVKDFLSTVTTTWLPRVITKGVLVALDGEDLTVTLTVRRNKEEISDEQVVGAILEALRNESEYLAQLDIVVVDVDVAS